MGKAPLSEKLTLRRISQKLGNPSSPYVINKYLAERGDARVRDVGRQHLAAAVPCRQRQRERRRDFHQQLRQIVRAVAGEQIAPLAATTPGAAVASR